MKTVFADVALEKEVKAYRLLGDFAYNGISLPFFKQTSYRKRLPEAF